MTRIFLWSADSAGCAYYRCSLPAGALTDRGHDTLVATVMPDEWRETADVIVGQRVCLPGATQRWQELAREGRAKLVFEIDDDLLAVDPSNGPAWSYFSQPHIRENLTRNVEVADLVITSTAPLAEVMRQHNPNVDVLPNSVPAALLDAPRHQRTDGIGTIGWGGGVSHAMDWADVTNEVVRFITRSQGTELHLMGWQPPNLWNRLPEARRRFTPWVESVPRYYTAVDFHVGLAPLRPHVFNRSKSPVKALEYAALGIPCVASDAGPYSDFVRHGETGFLARQPHEWAKHLRQLLDPVTRQEMGAKARSVAAEHTIENQIHLWEKALCS